MFMIQLHTKFDTPQRLTQNFFGGEGAESEAIYNLCLILKTM